jgi:hypothetical protein
MVIPFRPRHPEPPRERIDPSTALVWGIIAGGAVAIWAYALVQVVLLL